MSGIPGDSMDVTLADGRSLHYRTAGSGSPTVVLEAGMGSSLGGWASVVPGIAGRTDRRRLRPLRLRAERPRTRSPGTSSASPPT